MPRGEAVPPLLPQPPPPPPPPFPLPLSLLLALLCITDTALAFGAMSTVAPMRGSFTDARNSFALCVLRAGTTHPFCWATFSIDGNTSPPPNSSLWSISGGAYFSCGLSAGSRSPLCWGQSPGSAVPEEFQLVSYSEINCGGWHVCAVRSNSSATSRPGQVDCWGSNQFGQIVHPDRPSQMVSITAGDYFSCALVASTRRPRCWGKIAKAAADMHDAHDEDRTIPIPEDMVFFRIFAGRTHVCGILLHGREAMCWGNDDHGQCDRPKGITFAVLAAGNEHSCGIRDDTHEVICWGNNKFGQLEVPSDVEFATIAAGDYYTCGVTLGERQLFCWGSARSPKTVRVKDGFCAEKCGAEEYTLTNGDVNDCSGAEEKICLPCAKCKSGSSFETSPCVPFSDRSCSSCRWCFQREKADHPCRLTCPPPSTLPQLPSPGTAAASEPASLHPGYAVFRQPDGSSDQSSDGNANGVVALIIFLGFLLNIA